MKNLILIALFIFGGILSTKAQQETYTLTVHISGLKSDKGSVLIAVYNNEDSFLKKELRGDDVLISKKNATVVFKNVPKGTYAVSFFHDENGNKKLDTNFMGIPKEKYGCSNNAKGFMGPPKYNDAKFSLQGNLSINIAL